MTTTEEHTVVQILIFKAYGRLIAKTSNKGEYSFLEKMKSQTKTKDVLMFLTTWLQPFLYLVFLEIAHGLENGFCFYDGI